MMNKYLVTPVIILMICVSMVFAQVRKANVEGTIRDQNGDIVVGAKVFIKAIIKDTLNPTLETASDERGHFYFNSLGDGAYSLRVEVSGFANYEEIFNLSDTAPTRNLTIKLRPTIVDTIIINGDTLNVSMDPQNAAGSQVLKERDLSLLPDDPDNLVEHLKLLATSSGSAPGQATITVDGFTSEGRLPPKSAIREIRINPDLFSAEFDKAPYQGGRIQIFTKPGAISFNGSAFVNFNSSAFNARDAFAPSRAPSTTSRYGFQFGGPLIRNRVGFLLDFEGRNIDESVSVNATVLNNQFVPSAFAANVTNPKRLLIGSARIDGQINPANTFVARYEVNNNRLTNQGTGGFNLSERGFTRTASEHSFKLSETAIISSSRFNEVRLGITRLSFANQATSSAPTINVPGAFVSGGATLQAQEQNEWLVEIADNFSIISGKHNLTLGAQIFGKYIDSVRNENFNGTYIFGGAIAPKLNSQGGSIIDGGEPVLITISGLEQYRRTLLGLPGGVATRFSITTGNQNIGIRQWKLATFIQDEWRLRPTLSLSLGLRYEAQTSPSDKLSLAPRIGLAYSPGKKRDWVLRLRGGLFYDRINESLSLETVRLDGIRQQQIIIDSPSFPDPFNGGNVNDAVPTSRRFDEKLYSPVSLQMQIGVEHQLSHGWKIQLSQSWSQGWGSLRSRNINAPLVDGISDLTNATRPFGIRENILQFESSGKLRGQVLFVGLNQKSKRFNLFSGYLFFNFHTDTDSAFTLPQSSYDLAGEWARPIWQSRHRLFAVGQVYLPWKFQAMATVNAASGTPFNIITGRDNNGDGNFNDRPGIVSANDPNAIVTEFGILDAATINGTLPRNVGTNPATISADLNLSRTFDLSKLTSKDTAEGQSESRYRMTVNTRISNLFNHTNVTGLNGILTSPFFGRANAALPSRRIELGLRFNF